VEQEWVREINGEPMATYIDWMRSCSRITVSAHPAVSVPAGLAPPALAPPALAPSALAPSGLAPSALAPSGLAPSALAPSGLPVGLQLVGRYGGDRRLLEIAAGIMALPG
jgi:amidase